MKKPKLTSSGLIDSQLSSPYRTIKIVGNTYRITTKFKEELKIPKRSIRQQKEVSASIQKILDCKQLGEIE